MLDLANENITTIDPLRAPRPNEQWGRVNLQILCLKKVLNEDVLQENEFILIHTSDRYRMMHSYVQKKIYHHDDHSHVGSFYDEVVQMHRHGDVASC